MRLAEKALDKLRPGWRERSRRRKSLWHLPKVIISFIVMGILWYIFFIGMWAVHLIVYPEHTGRLDEFWSEGLALKPFISSFLLAMPLFLPAMGASFIVVNLLFWLIRSRESGICKRGCWRQRDDIFWRHFSSIQGVCKIFTPYWFWLISDRRINIIKFKVRAGIKMYNETRGLVN